MNAAPLIAVRHLAKSFGKQRVLEDIALEVPAGSTTVILGPSGCGKTVLLKHIIGLLKPDAGEVIVEGEDIVPMAQRQIDQVRRKFGMVFQASALFDSMTVGENVAFPQREHAPLPEVELRHRVEERLEHVGLSGVFDKFPSDLSGGMKKRVALARALMLDPKIVLYDEPTTGLDPITTDSVDEMIMTAKKKFGVTSVVISHDIGSAFKVADQLAVLHQGRFVAIGAPEAVRHSDHPFVKSFFALWFSKGVATS